MAKVQRAILTILNHLISMVPNVRQLILAFLVLMLAGCSNMHIRQAINEHDQMTGQIELGDSKEAVLAILQPIQAKVPYGEQKRAERFMEKDVLVEIYYARSAIYHDGLVTDDEFTPYVFHDGVLVGIGWQALGGPKTQGQTQQLNNTIPRSWDPYWNYY